MRKNRLKREGIVIMILIFMFLGVGILFLYFEITDSEDADAYTEEFLEQRTEKELLFTVKKLDSQDIDEVGIPQNGILVYPKTNEDKKILEILRRCYIMGSITMQRQYFEVDEEDIIRKVEIINKKFSTIELFVGKEDSKDGEIKIYSGPKGYKPKGVTKITD